MILDTHENLNRYTSLFRDVDPKSVFYWLQTCKAMETGVKLDFFGDMIFARMLHPETGGREKFKWESHRNYVDLQYVVGGGEAIEWAPAAEMIPAGDYDQGKDVQFYREADPTQRIQMKKGMFVFLLPTDAHKPQVSDGIHAFVHKAVVKIHRSLLIV